MKKLSKEQKQTIVAAFAGLIMAAITILLVRLGIFEQSELKSYDFRTRLRGIEAPRDDIVVIKVDDGTLDYLQLMWPFPRAYHAQLIENLNAAGVKAILFDVEFFGPQDSPEDSLGPNDSALAEAIAKHPNVVIGKKWETETPDGAKFPFPAFRYPGQMAYVDMVPDQDSFIRRVRIAEPPEGMERSDVYDTDDLYFGLKAVSMMLGIEKVRYVKARHEFQMGDMRIPVDADRTMLINYASTPFSFSMYSYFQVWDRDTPWGIEILIKGGHLRDKIVLIGATYVEAHDAYPTPFYAGEKLFSKDEHLMPGVEIHANVINTVLNQDFLRRQSTFWQYALIVLCTVLIGLVAMKLRLILGVPIVVLSIVIYAIVGTYVLIHSNLWMPIVAPCAAILLSYTGTTSYRVIVEQREKRFIRGHFSHYVPQSVVQELLQNPEMAQLGGTERELSALFSDVQGFTSISEKLGPTELRVLLDEYLTQMTDCVIKHGGIIDKYEGDAIMAEFGAPIYLEDHAHRACLAALEMQERLVKLREKLAREGRPIVWARVGIASGMAVIGNMGSSGIPGSSDPVFDYTAIGDCVNLASRLEGANKQYGTYIMISDETRKKLPEEMVTRELDAIIVVGKTKAIRVYEVIARNRSELSEDKAQMLSRHQQGLEAYRAREWDEAIGHFRAVLSLDPDDGPAKVYIERCEASKVTPPEEGWDGSFRLTEK